MDDQLTRIWTDLLGRLDGPFAFRFLFQPAMATLYAIRDGVKDARLGRPPYLWALLTGDGDRHALVRDGRQAVGRVIALGVIMDVLYQLIVFRWIYPVELVLTVVLLAFVPYLLLRGPAGRVARALFRSRTTA